jgi:hypothetical protein
MTWKAVQARAAQLQGRGLHACVADEIVTDSSLKVKAMCVREIYNVGRGTSTVMVNADGVWLDGWYGWAPTIEKLTLAADRQQLKMSKR